MNLSSISSRRTELMGFAMLIVVWYHLPITTHILAIDFLRGNGCIGVDIFLLLSGFGLAYSTKNGLRLSDYRSEVLHRDPHSADKSQKREQWSHKRLSSDK